MALKEGGLRGSLRSVGGIPAGLVEDWSRSQPLNDYEGDVSDYTIISNGAFQGDNYATTDSFARIDSSNRPNIPSQGDVFSCRVRRPSSGEGLGGFCWGTQGFDTDVSGYELIIFNQDFILRRIDSGSVTTIATETTSIPENEWLKMITDWGVDGEITCTLLNEDLDEISSISTTDDTYTSGGAGWVVNEADVDFYKIEG